MEPEVVALPSALDASALVESVVEPTVAPEVAWVVASDVAPPRVLDPVASSAAVVPLASAPESSVREAEDVQPTETIDAQTSAPAQFVKDSSVVFHTGTMAREHSKVRASSDIHAARSTLTVSSPWSPRSTWTDHGRQHTSQSSTYAPDTSGSTHSSIASKHHGQVTVTFMSRADSSGTGRTRPLTR
jgi:hypothetical protein